MYRRDSGDGVPVQRGSTGPATGLLGMADREQPFHGRAVRLVHAGSRIRARQHQAGEQHSDRRSAGEHRRDQVRHRVDPLRYRLEAAGISQDDRVGALGSAAGPAEGSRLQCRRCHQGGDRPRPLGSCRPIVRPAQCRALCATRGTQGDRVGAQLSGAAHPGDQLRSRRLQPYAGLRLYAAHHRGGLRQGAEGQGRDRRRRDGDRCRA